MRRTQRLGLLRKVIIQRYWNQHRRRADTVVSLEGNDCSSQALHPNKDKTLLSKSIPSRRNDETRSVSTGGVTSLSCTSKRIHPNFSMNDVLAAFTLRIEGWTACVGSLLKIGWRFTNEKAMHGTSLAVSTVTRGTSDRPVSSHIITR